MLFTVAEHHQNSEILHLFKGPVTQKRDLVQKKKSCKTVQKGQKTHRNHKK